MRAAIYARMSTEEASSGSKRCCALAFALLGLACGSRERNEPPAAVPPISYNSLAEIQAELDEWGSGRWQSVVLSPKANGAHLAVEIAISGEANSVAHASYCDVIRDAIAPRLVDGQTWRASLNVAGRSVRTCP